MWFSGRNYVIRLYLKTPESFEGLISKMDSGLCKYHLAVWLNLNTQFLVDSFNFLVVFSFVFILYKFAAAAF